MGKYDRCRNRMAQLRNSDPFQFLCGPASTQILTFGSELPLSTATTPLSRPRTGRTVSKQLLWYALGLAGISVLFYTDYPLVHTPSGYRHQADCRPPGADSACGGGDSCYSAGTISVFDALSPAVHESAPRDGEGVCDCDCGGGAFGDSAGSARIYYAHEVHGVGSGLALAAVHGPGVCDRAQPGILSRIGSG